VVGFINLATPLNLNIIMEKYRVIAKMYTIKTNDEVFNEMIQYLQIKTKTLFGKLKWETIDQEIVPSYVWIHKACFGDESNWKSKFKDIPNCKFKK